MSRRSNIHRRMASNEEVTSYFGDPTKVGMELEVAELFRIGGRPWTSKRPEDADDYEEMFSTTAKSALIVRRHRADDNGEYRLVSVTVQSPLIRNLLHKVFDGYKGVSTRLQNLSFSAPFREFFYRWDTFQQQISEEKDELTLKHIELLQNVIAPEIEPHIATRDDLLSQNLITFEYLWSIFEPGVEVLSRVKDCNRLFILDKSQNGRGGYVLNCRYIDFNGTFFGYNSASLMIPGFKGVLPLNELSVIPVDLHPDPEGLRADMLRRGRLFESLTGVHFKSYAGLYTNYSVFGEKSEHTDGCRIVIDAKMFYQNNGHYAVPLQALSSSAMQPKKHRRARDPDDDEDDEEWEYSDLENDCGYNPQAMPPPAPPMPPMPPQPMPTFGYQMGFCTPMPVSGGVAHDNDISEDKKKPRQLTERECRLCTSTLKGFNIFTHEWGNFFIDQIREIEFSAEAFPRLVLPYDYKELILAITKSQLSCKDQFDDVIHGKGQGIIMLLQGEPGVGKTLTAEATAEEMKRPLYAVSAGELGYSAGEVEANLRRILEMSTKWQAVLLIDECDVFLEQRTLSDIDRNRLVAVFLRLLEYFKGVMFLTANRVSTFDPAFQSRIHLSINYPQLDVSSRKHVWRTFIPEKVAESDEPQESELNDAEIAALAAIELNGREIKNIVKTARLLSTSKGTPLSMKHVNTVLRIKSRAASNH